MSKIGILFPHQLFEKHPIHQACDKIYLVEEYLFFKQYNFHKQKIAFHRASMKAFEKHLDAQNIELVYVEAVEKNSDIRKLIPHILKNEKPSELHIVNPTDYWLELRINEALEKSEVIVTEYENPLFLNTKEELSTFFRVDKKSFFQTTWYKQERKKRNILLEEKGEPAGGKWTYDIDNRKKYPRKKTPPTIQFPETNDTWKEALEYVSKNFASNIGELDKAPLYPTDYKSAQAWLKQFLEFRFHEFGDYEDSIVQQENILNHSLLTPMMNVGLISPQNVLDKALAFAKKENVPLNSTEGFVRQIIGWREFIRGMYECKGVESRTSNFWNFKRKIPASFYDGTTGIVPVDKTIKKVLKTGYCHHIERLMILGNFMLLCEFDPKEVYRWFMELFIDAYDWVMVPNVYGMSQFSDGGFFATKPYIGGSNYLKKMSDYPKGDWQPIWDGLYWNFIDKQKDFFLGNPRMSMMARLFDKMAPEKKETHLKNAASFFDQLDAS